jgi:hypothetical protein
MDECEQQVNPWAIVDAKSMWFYRMIGGAIVWTIGPGRRTANGVPFVEIGSGVWVSIQSLVENWERSESLTGPWEPVQ